MHRFIIFAYSFLIAIILPIALFADENADKVATVEISGETIFNTKMNYLGELLNVRLSFKGFESQGYFDIYLAIQFPDGQLWFLESSGGLFQASIFNPLLTPYVKNTQISDVTGSVLAVQLPKDIALVGQYAVYAVLVPNGGNPFDPAQWAHQIAVDQVFVNRNLKRVQP